MNNNDKKFKNEEQRDTCVFLLYNNINISLYLDVCVCFCLLLM